MSNARLAGLAVAAVLVGAAPASAATIDLGDAGTTASRLVADMQALALTHQGHTVNRVAFGSARQAAAALDAGSVDGYVAESDRIVELVYAGAKRRNEANMRSFIAAQVAADGSAAVGYSAADDAPAVACRRQIVTTYRFTALTGLPAVAGALRYGATPEHMLRADGYWALRSTFKWVAIRRGAVRFGLIANKRLDCVESSKAEPRAARAKLATLSDVKRRLAGTPRRTVLVVDGGALGATPEIQTTAEQIGAKLTRAALVRLRGSVEIDGHTSMTTAQSFLVSIGVLPPT